MGTDQNARHYLADLDRGKDIHNLVDAHADDISETIGLRKTKTIREQKHMMKLFTGAIRSDYENMYLSDEEVKQDDVEYDDEEEQLDDTDNWDSDDNV